MSGAERSETANIERSEQRGSWGRVFEKLRAVVRRQGSSGEDLVARGAGGQTEEAAGSVQTPAEPFAASSSSASERKGAETATARLSATIERTSFDVDDDIAENTDEALLPTVTRRTGMDADKARALFERHGLNFEPRMRSSGEEPTPKVRRVEKPIRVRLHYRCHECQGHFAKNKACTKCGHRRCAECTRQPGTGVQEMMESGRQAMAEEQHHGGSSIIDWATHVAKEPAVAPPSEVAETSSLLLEKDDAAEGDMNLTQTYDLFVKTARPRSGQELIPRQKTQIIRRSCHKCETPFLPPSRTDCEKCTHTRCSLCPRWPAKADKWRDGSPGDVKALEEEVQMVQAVQRVYRKPRVRVRYTCDQCQAVFVDRHICQGCGHEKCAGCSRNPRKRVPIPDPAVEQAVDDRLNAFQGVESQRPMATAAS